ncbi:MAG: hypothetical protein OXD46_12300 [Chloroflexi bacterium]|nr:hypothetical protein [Chloroflexota bacterium]
MTDWLEFTGSIGPTAAGVLLPVMPCGSHFTFKLAALEDGTNRAAVWSEEAKVDGSTTDCIPIPENLRLGFHLSTYAMAWSIGHKYQTEA